MEEDLVVGEKVVAEGERSEMRRGNSKVGKQEDAADERERGKK